MDSSKNGSWIIPFMKFSGLRVNEYCISFQVFNNEEEVKDTINYPDIRIFVTNFTVSDSPLTDLRKGGILLSWSKSSPGILFPIIPADFCQFSFF